MESVPIFRSSAPFTNHQTLFLAREAELASRSDTGLRKQTGEGEAFTGGVVFFPLLPDPRPQTRSSALRHPLFTNHQPPLLARGAELAAEGDWHREAILAPRSGTGEGEAFATPPTLQQHTSPSRMRADSYKRYLHSCLLPLLP